PAQPRCILQVRAARRVGDLDRLPPHRRYPGTRHGNRMAAYLANWWIRAGLVLVVFGWGLLLAIIVLATLGLWPDPNPNPIGPGLLFFLTCWPAIICLVVGVIRVQRKAAAGPP